MRQLSVLAEQLAEIACELQQWHEYYERTNTSADAETMYNLWDTVAGAQEELAIMAKREGPMRKGKK